MSKSSSPTVSNPSLKSDSAGSQLIPSFFTGHELPAKEQLAPRERTRGYDGFFASILFLSFIIFVIVRVYSPRKLNQMFIAFVNPAAMNQLLREEYAFTNRSSLLLLLIYLLIFPLFVFQTALYFLHGTFPAGPSHFQGFKGYFLIMAFVFTAYLVKILFVRLVAFVFGLKAAGSEYVYSILLFNKVIGLVMYPLVLLISFAHQLGSGYLLTAGLSLLVMLLVYRTLRLMQIGLSTANVSFLYLFLYLCTLEILPTIVLVKLFMSSFS